MKKQLLKSALIAVAGVGLLAGSGWADMFNTNRPITPGASSDPTEPTLQTILSNDATNGIITSGSVDVINDQSKAAIWQPTDGGSNAYEIVGFSSWSSTLGIYSYTSGQEITFDFFDTANNAVIEFFDSTLNVIDDNGNKTYKNFGTTFGFYLEVQQPNVDGTFTTYKYYTEDSKNNDVAMALAYDLAENTKLEWTLPNAETKKFTTTGDDWILAWEDGGGDFDYNDQVFLIEDIEPIPEPATLLLFGTGLASLAGYARRKSSK